VVITIVITLHIGFVSAVERKKKLGMKSMFFIILSYFDFNTYSGEVLWLYKIGVRTLNGTIRIVLKE
jgi:hypothetical protein